MILIKRVYGRTITSVGIMRAMFAVPGHFFNGILV